MCAPGFTLTPQLFHRQSSQTLSQEDTREYFPYMLPLGLALEEDDIAFQNVPVKQAERMCDVDDYIFEYRKSQNQFPPTVNQPEQVICDVEEWFSNRTASSQVSINQIAVSFSLGRRARACMHTQAHYFRDDIHALLISMPLS